MNIGPSSLKAAETMLGGPCVGIPMLMLLKKQPDDAAPPISIETMQNFVSEFNHSSYTGKRPMRQLAALKKDIGVVDIMLSMMGVTCKQFEKTKRISEGSFYWIYLYEGFFIPVKGIWGDKRYNLSMRRVVLKYFDECIRNNMIYVLRGVVTKNKESNRIGHIEFYNVECFSYAKISGIVNDNHDW